jgi:hypothetical protein
MPEGKGYGPQDTASIGKNLNVIGNHLYGCSGAVSVSNTAVTLIEDTTGNYYTIASWIGNYNQDVSESLASEDYRFALELNGVRVASCESSDAQGSARNTLLDIMIPPFTHVKIEGRNYSGSGSEDVGAVLIGRIYK